MKIRYLLDGVSKMSDDVEVVAKGVANYFILHSRNACLKAIPEEAVTSKIYQNADDEPPDIMDFVESNIIQVQDVDYSLVDLFQIQH